MALVAPSVNQGQIEGGLQVNGASGAENAYTVDGVVTNSVVNGGARQNAAFEYLQEVQVKTTGVPAEYGGALGGVVSAVTKSGGNTFQGEGHYYYFGSGLSASPVNRLVLNPSDDLTVNYFQDRKEPDHNSEFGGSIGGPIIRDRLFFFGSVSPRVSRQTRSYALSDGTADVSRKPDGDAGIRQIEHGDPPWRPRTARFCTRLRRRAEPCSPLMAQGRTPSSAPRRLFPRLRAIGWETNQISTTGTRGYPAGCAEFRHGEGRLFSRSL